jgi:transcription initiation factor TFIID subunit 8
MSYPTFPYGAYQPTAASYVPYQSGHYPSQYPATPAAQSISFQSYQIPTQPILKSSPPPDLPPPPPDLTAITPKVASNAVRRLLFAVLRDAGFDAAQTNVLQRLEVEAVACKFVAHLCLEYPGRKSPIDVERLYERAHEYANLANRAGPIVKDLLLACGDVRLQTKDLQASLNHSKKRKRGTVVQSAILDTVSFTHGRDQQIR